MNDHEHFAAECAAEVDAMGNDQSFREQSQAWMDRAQELRYSYHFRWMGLPIIQYPQDIVAMQELIWRVQPELVIETGVARGGSLVFYASMLELLGRGEVLGIDIDIRAHNREAIEAHPMARRIRLLQGSSVDAAIVARAAEAARGKKVMVVLDSNHTHEHVLAELKLYAPLVSPGSYCVVMDTVVENMPDRLFGDRPWGVGDNPLTAVREFLAAHPEFETDRSIHDKLAVTVAPEGYLHRRT
jgi:cephalosporin hydroxylase